MDDVLFSYHWTCGQIQSNTLCLEEVHHVAVPVGRQTTIVFGRVHQNVALQLTCCQM